MASEWAVPSAVRCGVAVNEHACVRADGCALWLFGRAPARQRTENCGAAVRYGRQRIARARAWDKTSAS